jgi:hypothetical protein
MTLLTELFNRTPSSCDYIPNAGRQIFLTKLAECETEPYAYTIDVAAGSIGDKFLTITVNPASNVGAPDAFVEFYNRRTLYLLIQDSAVLYTSVTVTNGNQIVAINNVPDQISVQPLTKNIAAGTYKVWNSLPILSATEATVERQSSMVNRTDLTNGIQGSEAIVKITQEATIKLITRKDDRAYYTILDGAKTENKSFYCVIVCNDTSRTYFGRVQIRSHADTGAIEEINSAEIRLVFQVPFAASTAYDYATPAEQKCLSEIYQLTGAGVPVFSFPAIIGDTFNPAPVFEPTLPEGLVYYYGTNRNTQAWSNPVTNRTFEAVGTRQAVLQQATSYPTSSTTASLFDRTLKDRNSVGAFSTSATGNLAYGTSAGVTFNFQFVEPVTVTDYVIEPTHALGNVSNSALAALPQSWLFQASTDQVTWTTLDTRVLSASDWGVTTTTSGSFVFFLNASDVKILRFPVNNSTPYQYYRLASVVSFASASSSQALMNVSNFELLGTASNTANLSTVATRKLNFESELVTRRGTSIYQGWFHTWQTAFRSMQRGNTFTATNVRYLQNGLSGVPPVGTTYNMGSFFTNPTSVHYTKTLAQDPLDLEISNNSLIGSSNYIEIWFKRGSISTANDQTLIYSRGITSPFTTTGELYFTPSNTLNFTFDNRVNLKTIATVTDTNWHYLVIQFGSSAGSTFTAHLDGVLVLTTTRGTAVNPFSGGVTLGAGSTTPASRTTVNYDLPFEGSFFGFNCNNLPYGADPLTFYNTYSAGL